MSEPKRLGKYEIIEEIGRGGFAIVYRALDTTLEREVALKVLHPQLLADRVFVERFRREARALARLDHPHIITVYEVSEIDANLCIGMQLARGPNLGNAIAERGHIPWQEVIAMLEPVCEGLDYAHRQGVVHRDLKPSNVLLDEERGPLLADFGIARLVGSSTASLTFTGGVVGTPAYIAPEIWEEDVAEPPADVYALGCIVYEMLTGDVLFAGTTPMQSMRAHDKGPRFPAQWPEGVPGGVNAALDRALARTPADRYASASALWYALKDLEVEARATDDARHVEALVAQWQSETEKAIRSKEWSAAKMAMGRWLAIAPGDANAKEALTRIEEQLQASHLWRRRLERQYEQLQAALAEQDWSMAETRCLQILAVEPEYRDVPAQWARVQKERTRLRERVAALYEEAAELAEARQWRQTLAKMEEIGALDPQFADPEGIASRARLEAGRGAQARTQQRARERAAPLERPAMRPSPSPPRAPVTSWAWVLGAAVVGTLPQTVLDPLGISFSMYGDIFVTGVLLIVVSIWAWFRTRQIRIVGGIAMVALLQCGYLVWDGVSGDYLGPHAHVILLIVVSIWAWFGTRQIWIIGTVVAVVALLLLFPFIARILTLWTSVLLLVAVNLWAWFRNRQIRRRSESVQHEIEPSYRETEQRSARIEPRPPQPARHLPEPGAQALSGRKLLIRWAIVTLALLVAAWLIPGIFVDGSGWVLYAMMAAILGLINAAVRPVLRLLMRPWIVVALGLFTLVINALALLLTAWIASMVGVEFYVASFWSAFFGGLVVSLVAVALSGLVKD